MGAQYTLEIDSKFEQDANVQAKSQTENAEKFPPTTRHSATRDQLMTPTRNA